MNWITELGIALSLVVISGGFMAYLIISKVFRWIKEMEGHEKSNKDLEKRIKTLEQRLADMQEIMLSIDERLNHPLDGKLDRMKPSQSPVETA